MSPFHTAFAPLPQIETHPTSVSLSEQDLLMLSSSRLAQAQTEQDPLQRDLHIHEAGKLINALQSKRPLRAVLYSGG